MVVREAEAQCFTHLRSAWEHAADAAGVLPALRVLDDEDPDRTSLFFHVFEFTILE